MRERFRQPKSFNIFSPKASHSVRVSRGNGGWKETRQNVPPVEAQIAALKAKHEKELKEFREEMKEAQGPNDKRAQEEVATGRAEIETKVKSGR